MVSDLNSVFSNSAKGMKRSAIRELLKLTQRCDIISFAGGLPSPDSFPIEQLKEISCEVLEKEGAQALQYGSTEGDNKLREILVNRYRKDGVDITTNNLVITTASQQALDLIPKIFVNPGDKVICGLPSYLGALSAFSTYGAQMIGIRLDDKGMRADLLEKELEQMKAKGEKPKFIYIIPDFQNPTGRTWSLERRRRFIETVSRYGVAVLEDNPYGELRFEGEILPSIKSMDREGLVIGTGTFSKTFCPGMRIGWLVAAPPVIEKYVLIKQGADLCTSLRNQMEIDLFMELFDFEGNLVRLTELYRQRRNSMVAALEAMMPEGVSFTRPQGGLFLWVTLPERIKAIELLKRCLEQNVAFVPGDSFFPNGGVENTLRLNYSNMPEDRIREGVARLAAAIRSMDS